MNAQHNTHQSAQTQTKSGGMIKWIVILIVFVIIIVVVGSRLLGDGNQQSVMEDPPAPSAEGPRIQLTQEELNQRLADARREGEQRVLDQQAENSGDSSSEGSNAQAAAGGYRGEFTVQRNPDGSSKVCRSDIYVHIAAADDVLISDTQREQIRLQTLTSFCANPNQRLPTTWLITDMQTPTGTVRVRSWVSNRQ